MKGPIDDLVVLDIAGNVASVRCDFPGGESSLISLGFAREGDQFIRKIGSDADRLDLTKRLIKMRALFSIGSGWSPSDIVALYREQGLITESYREIAWSNPEEYRITER
jgi:hypothetical protein